MSVILTRKVHFCASHRYHSPAFSPEENRRIFGKCNNPNGHGHNYLAEISVRGRIDPLTGMVVDLKALSDLLDEVILHRYDHKNLNLDVPEFADRIPTTENLAIDIWDQLVSRVQGCRLYRVRLYEDPTLFADYYGPK